MVDITWKTAKSNRSSKGMDRDVKASYEKGQGKAVFVSQEDALQLSQQDIQNNLDSKGQPEVGYLYSNGCSPCVGIAMTGLDSDGNRVNILSHVDQDSEGNANVVIDHLLSQFESIDQIHMVSEMGFEPSNNPQYKTYQKLGKEVLSYFESLSAVDVKDAKVTASYQADAILIEARTGKIMQSKGVLSVENAVNPKIMSNAKGSDDTPDWLKTHETVVSQLAFEGQGSPDEPAKGPDLNANDQILNPSDPIKVDNKDDSPDGNLEQSKGSDSESSSQPSEPSFPESGGLDNTGMEEMLEQNKGVE